MAKVNSTPFIDRSPAPETLSRHITAPLALPGKPQGRTLLNLIAMLREEAAAGKHAAVDVLDEVEVMLQRQIAVAQRKAAVRQRLAG